MIKSALKEARNLLDYFINSDEDYNEKEKESLTHFLKALNAGCECDSYNGFNCGCEIRSHLYNEGLKVLNK